MNKWKNMVKMIADLVIFVYYVFVFQMELLYEYF